MKIQNWLAAVLMVAWTALGPTVCVEAAERCPELSIVFARGSGAERETNDNYLEFVRTIEAKIGGMGIDHQYMDLDYEAKGIGVDNVWTLLGAFFGAGDAYDFGASVDYGVKRLTQMVWACPKTKFVLGGYSQGAMVVSQGIHSIDASRVIYAATFGDPKIYLPEGKAAMSLSLFSPFTGTEKNLLKTGAIPQACKGEGLSDYRMYVPDCYAYEGMLGSYRPYEPEGYAGKLGTWCNKYDMFCSSYLSASSHTAYVSDGLYEDASRIIAAKIAKAFEIKDAHISSHDTAILIDSTGSMDGLIERYKTEALRLAKETLEEGGRVALYDYRDLGDPYEVNEHCNFDSCTLEKLTEGLEEIEVDGGGDVPESLLSASFGVMKKLNWQEGATKSLVVLTDAGYHEPDLDGRSLADVVKLSREIDPVNFYVITTERMKQEYEELTTATDGRAVSSVEELGELVDYIMERHDTLPRVEVDSEFDEDLPALTVNSVREINTTDVEIAFMTDAEQVLVAMNDGLLGVTKDKTITITGLKRNTENHIILVPLSGTRRGGSAAITVPVLEDGLGGITIPKTPNTGQAS